MKFPNQIAIAFAAIVWSSATVVHADPELDRLKAKYVQDLRMLYDQRTREGRLDDAKLVLAELKAIGAGGEVVPLPDPQPLLVNTAWETPTGTIFEFKPNGRGNRSFNNADRTAFTWKIRPDRLVEVTGPGSQGEADVTWFFRFENATDAFYGNRKDDVVRKLDKQ